MPKGLHFIKAINENEEIGRNVKFTAFLLFFVSKNLNTL